MLDAIYAGLSHFVGSVFMNVKIDVENSDCVWCGCCLNAFSISDSCKLLQNITGGIFIIKVVDMC